MTRLCQIAAPALLGLSLFVGGCAHERHEEIPASATMAVEGDERLVYAAPHDGKVYVYDVNDDRMVYSGDVEQGDDVTVEPDKNVVLVEGRTAIEDGVRNGHRHRIFFKKADEATRKTVVIEEQRIQRSK